MPDDIGGQSEGSMSPELGGGTPELGAADSFDLSDGEVESGPSLTPEAAEPDPRTQEQHHFTEMSDEALAATAKVMSMTKNELVTAPNLSRDEALTRVRLFIDNLTDDERTALDDSGQLENVVENAVQYSQLKIEDVSLWESVSAANHRLQNSIRNVRTLGASEVVNETAEAAGDFNGVLKIAGSIAASSYFSWTHKLPLVGGLISGLATGLMTQRARENNLMEWELEATREELNSRNVKDSYWKRLGANLNPASGNIKRTWQTNVDSLKRSVSEPSAIEAKTVRALVGSVSFLAGFPLVYFGLASREAVMQGRIQPADLAKSNDLNRLERIIAVIQNRDQIRTNAREEAVRRQEEDALQFAALARRSQLEDDLAQRNLALQIAVNEARARQEGYIQQGVAWGVATGILAGFGLGLFIAHHPRELEQQVGSDHATKGTGATHPSQPTPQPTQPPTGHEQAATGAAGAGAAGGAIRPEAAPQLPTAEHFNMSGEVVKAQHRYFGDHSVDPSYDTHVVRADLAGRMTDGQGHALVHFNSHTGQYEINRTLADKFGVGHDTGVLDFSHLKAAGHQEMTNAISHLHSATTEHVTSMQLDVLHHDAVHSLQHSVGIDRAIISEARFHGTNTELQHFLKEQQTVMKDLLENGKHGDITVAEGGHQIDEVRKAFDKWMQEQMRSAASKTGIRGDMAHALRVHLGVDKKPEVSQLPHHPANAHAPHSLHKMAKNLPTQQPETRVDVNQPVPAVRTEVVSNTVAHTNQPAPIEPIYPPTTVPTTAPYQLEAQVGVSTDTHHVGPTEIPKPTDGHLTMAEHARMPQNSPVAAPAEPVANAGHGLAVAHKPAEPKLDSGNLSTPDHMMVAHAEPKQSAVTGSDSPITLSMPKDPAPTIKVESNHPAVYADRDIKLEPVDTVDPLLLKLKEDSTALTK